jgi:hypothetical protein
MLSSRRRFRDPGAARPAVWPHQEDALGWVEPPAEPAPSAERIDGLERQRDGLQVVLAGTLEDPWPTGPDGRFCVPCGEIDAHADDCAVPRRDELLSRD